MKKILLASCIVLSVMLSNPAVADETAMASTAAANLNSSNIAATASSRANQNSSLSGDLSSPGASPVSHTAEGADYSAGAGDGAATADMAIDIASLFADRLVRIIVNWANSELLSNIMSTTVPIWDEANWFNIFISWNIVDTAITLGHAAVNKFMRDATNITASFAGAEGFVTDKWVGPHPRNTTVAIMGEVGVESQKFGSLAFDPKEYEGLKDAKKASARQLMDYRSEQLIEDQRSLSNVADTNWGLLYRAQQRSIKGLAGALELKSQLAALGEVESRISADYKNKPSALNTVASRRALNDALWLLKMNVMAARTKLRAETLELDFKPMTREPEIVAEEPEEPEAEPILLSPTGGQ